MWKKCLYTFICFLLFSTSIEADNISFIPLKADKSPIYELASMYQDSEGYLWFVTYRSLIKYDGYNTTEYSTSSNNSGSSNYNFQRVVEFEDYLYIGSQRGVLKFDKESGIITPVLDGISDNLIVAEMLKDPTGRVWIGAKQGLYRKDSNSDTVSKIELLIDGKDLTDIVDLAYDKSGYLWITTWHNGLYKLDLTQGKIYSFTDSTLLHSYSLYFDKNDVLWVGTWGEGLLRIDSVDGNSIKYTQYKNDPHKADSILDNIIYCITDGPDDTIWASGKGGLSILKKSGNVYPNSFINKQPGEDNNGLPDSEVGTILTCTDGTIWLGMFGGGVCKVDFKKTNFRNINIDKVKARYLSSTVHSYIPIDTDNFWMGLWGHGLIKCNVSTGDFQHYLNMPEFKDFTQTSTVDVMIEKSDASKIYFGSYNNGVWEYDNRTKDVKAINTATYENMPNDCIVSLCEDKNGRIWIGTSTDIAILEKNGRLLLLSDFLLYYNSISPLQANDIFCDSNGDIWLATNNDGIVRIKEKTRQIDFFGHNDNLWGGSFNSIYADSEGRVWAGSTGEGLFVFDSAGKIFKRVENLELLKDVGITNIFEDPKGDLWFTTDNLVVSASIDDINSISINHISNISSYRTNIFSKNSGLYFPETDEVAFGCLRGLVAFPCSKGGQPEAPVNIVISDLYINSISYNDLPSDNLLRKNGGKKNINQLADIYLKHFQNNISINYSILDYGDVSLATYHYRFYRRNTKNTSSIPWQIVSGERNQASLSNLAPGKYVFEVFGNNTELQSTSGVKKINITIVGNPFLQWYAFLAYSVLLISLVLLIGNLIVSKIKNSRRIEFERMNQMKTEEVDQAKLQFFTNVSHEFLTPLSIILASIDSLSLKSDKDKGIAKVLSSNALRLTRLVQQILEFRKAETDNLKLLVSKGDMARFIGSCVDAFIPLVKKNNLNIYYYCYPEHIVGYYDADKLDKIVYNLISNAVKYTSEGETITVEAKLIDNSHLQLSCTNKGDIMSPQVISGLFKRFYEGNYRKFNTIGTGIGLSLVNRLVTLHKGEIEVKSDAEIGNRFTVTLPILKEAYSTDEIDNSDKEMVSPPLALQMNENVIKKDYHVLFVDDSLELCEVYTAVFSKSFDVTTALSAKEAIRILGEQRVDVIVSDIDMPEMDGLQLCRYIKEQIEYSHIPIILLTAMIDDAHHIEGYKQGVDGYLTKPCNFYVLRAMIDNLMSKQENKAENFQKQLVFDVKDIDYTSMDKKFLQDAINVVNEHISDSEFNQGDFVEAMNTSRTVLTEKLKSLTGLTPVAFIMNTRLTLAYKLIHEEKDKMRVADLAYTVGFQDAKYFSKRFKAKYGKSPREMIDSIE